MKYINEGHILKVIRMVYKCNCLLFEMENVIKHLCNFFPQKTTTLIVLSAELHLSKSNECCQLFLLYGGGMATSCLATMNWKMLGWLFVHLSDSV